MTDQLLDERVAGTLTKTYQYGAGGQRLSQTTIKPDGSKQDGFYGYNAHTDVEAVTDAAGDTRSTYGYTAYGSDDSTGFTGIDKPDPAAPDKQPDNVYRFNGKRWDAVTGSYDMGFRDYNPGLNRFLTRDAYTGALADLNLGTDPYTGNRYAFTGGNPITGIELDGHLTGAQCGPDGIRCGMTDIANSDDYTPLPPPSAPAGDGPNVVQRSLAGRLWNAGSNAVHQGAAWVDHNSGALAGMAGDTAETLLGGAATIAGGAMVASGVATCVASLPLAASGVGAIVTASACAAGAAEAVAGVTVAGAGIAAMVDGGSKFRDDFNRLERTGDTSGGGDRAASEQVTVDEALRGLPKGRQPNVRTAGSDAELQDVYDTLSRGGTPIEYPGYKGSWIERPDGIRVGLRDASKSGGRAIDIRYPDGTILKVHIR